LLGSRTGRVFRMGQAMRARLENVSLDRLEIDLLPATDGDGAAVADAPLADADERREAVKARHSRRDAKAADDRRARKNASSGKSARKPRKPSSKSAAKPTGKSSGKPAAKPTGKPARGRKSPGGKPAGQRKTR